MRFQRGAILIETALTVGLVLTLMVFSIQVGLVGFMQETADAASFVYGHAAVVGVNNPGGPGAVVNGIFPQIPVSSVVGSPTPAVTPNLGGVNYGYNGTAADQLAAPSHRHGGVSFVTPQKYDVSLSKANIVNLRGFPVGVSSKSSEAYDRECGEHFNVSGSLAPCGDPSAPPNYQVNNLSNGENTPPYFMGFNYQYQCTDLHPWSGSYCSTATSVDAFDMSAALYGHLSSFVAGSRQDMEANGSEDLNTGGLGGSTGTGNLSNEGTFAGSACVQRAAGWLASFLQTYPNLGDLYRDFYAGPGPLPTKPLFQYERGYYPNYNGIYYHLHMLSNWQYAKIVGSSMFDFQTDSSIEYLYSNGVNTIAAGYPSSSYSAPGAFEFRTRSACAYAQASPKYGYAY